jgi:hypothetical protein
MKKLVILFVAVFVTVFTLSLISVSEVRGRGAPVKSAEPSRTFDANYNAVWTATIKTASQVGYTILSMDKTSGLIMTDYFTVREPFMIRPGYRYKLNIQLVKISGSQTQVNINSFWEMGFEQSKSGLVRWQVTPRRDVNLETKLFDAIQSQL